MAAYTPPIPFVATRNMLADWFHREFTGCMHNEDSGATECGSWADRLLASGFVQDGGEFIGTLGDNPTVQGVIREHLAEAWADGHDNCVSPVCTCPNPYKETS